jgi:phosphatidylserine/phosphatidylglycerophosphate/cardiolipin synthase-like enzyme
VKHCGALWCALWLAACALRPDAASSAHDVVDGGVAENAPQRIEVLFATNQHGRPEPSCSRPMCMRLTELIRRAQHSVDFAIYGIRSQNAVIDALVEAQVRGVRVRGVVDTEGEACDKFSYLDSGLLRQRLAEGSVTCDSGAGHGYIMHNKFFVIDEELVWTGSTNLSDSELGGEYYADVAVVVREPELAAVYTHELEEMFGGLHHRAKLDDTPHQLGHELECYFSPSDQPVENAVLPLIESAQHTLDVAMFYFTERRIADAMNAAAARGVRVRMVLDAGGAQNKYSRHLQLCDAGVPVKIENWGGKAHNKWAVADAARVLVGSLNWTAAANDSNDENTLLISSPSVAAQFVREFERQWADLPESLICARVEVEGPTSSECTPANDCSKACAGGSCCDGLDNDHDGRIDMQEEACGCGDGVDNDRDGYLDGDDFDCQSEP